MCSWPATTPPPAPGPGPAAAAAPAATRATASPPTAPRVRDGVFYQRHGRQLCRAALPAPGSDRRVRGGLHGRHGATRGPAAAGQRRASRQRHRHRRHPRVRDGLLSSGTSATLRRADPHRHRRAAPTRSWRPTRPPPAPGSGPAAAGGTGRRGQRHRHRRHPRVRDGLFCQRHERQLRGHGPGRHRHGVDVFVAAYAAGAGHGQWASSGGRQRHRQGNGIATDGTRVYVTGYFTSGTQRQLGGHDPGRHRRGGQADVFVAAYAAGPGPARGPPAAGGSGTESATASPPTAPACT